MWKNYFNIIFNRNMCLIVQLVLYFRNYFTNLYAVAGYAENERINEGKKTRTIHGIKG